MAERQETSVMVSIQEILRDAQSREEQEKVEAERRAREEEQRRVDEIRRQQDEQQARLRGEEEDRQRRAFEERRRQAEITAMQEAAVQKARMEAEAQARLAEMASRHDHERQLRLLGEDKHKKRLTMLVASLGVFLFVAAIGGGILIKSQIDKANLAEANAAELRAQIDEGKATQAKLERDLASTKDPEQIAALTAKLADQQRKLQEMERTGQVPRPAGPAPAARAPKPGGGPSKPCNCTPGDPLCSCL